VGGGNEATRLFKLYTLALPVGYQKLKSGTILLPIGLSVSTLKDIIFELNLATAATERRQCRNHSAFLEDEEGSTVLSGRSLQKNCNEEIFENRALILDICVTRIGPWIRIFRGAE
jgi:hypothetical protein